MKPTPHIVLPAALFTAATLACSGCVQPVERPAVANLSSSDQQAPHNCRSSVAQTTQKGCRAMTAIARK